MAEIPMPAGDLEDVEIELDQNFQVNRSAWTGRRRVSGLPGAQKWYASATVPDIATEEQERPWRLFKLKMRGPVNRARLKVACSQQVGKNPLVSAGANPFSTLPLQGLRINATILQAGQYMTVPLPSGHHRIVMLMEDLETDATGKAVAEFSPELGEVPTAGTVVEITDPYMHVAFVDSRQGWKVGNGVTDMPLVFEEAL